MATVQGPEVQTKEPGAARWDPGVDSWRHRLSFKLAAGLAVFFVVFSASTYLAMRLRGRDAIAEQSDRLTGELGRKLVLQLKQHIEASEVLVRTLATLGEAMPKDEATFRRLVPAVIDLEVKRDLIAGGGIWPEPGKFREGVARRSFFWGRNSAGKLEYFDDYNTPDGPGYHNEEWYEPARYAKPGQVYWSKSYMDPYSFEPMITCTAPMHRDGVFTGVATIDLKLNGIAAIMRELASAGGGYAFVVDRNNKFICFPDPKIASRSGVDANGKATQEQRDVDDVANERPAFRDVATALTALDGALRCRIFPGEAARFDQIARRLETGIPQLARGESQRIAAGLTVADSEMSEPMRLELKDDHVLGEPAQMLIYEMPSTHWRVALAVPVRNTQLVVDSVIHRVQVLLLGASLSVCVLAWLYFHRELLRPLARITRHLRRLVNANDLHAHLPVHGNDELAKLSYWFNVRTNLLGRAYEELKVKNQQLDEARLTAESADRSKNIFLASMSHELRTPLNSIIGMSGFMNGTKLDPEQSEYVRTIHSSSNALLDLVNDIMDFSKIEAGQLELESTDFDLRQVLDEITDMLTYQASEKGLGFLCLLDPECEGWVRGDPGRVRQIIANLGANAVKFTRAGAVTLRGCTRREPDGAWRFEFSVSDSGIGIPAEARERLFKPYSQAVSSTTREYGGSGLGLAICKRLCQLMRGDIDYVSHPGEGTTFSFSLKLAVAATSDPRQSLPNTMKPGGWQALVIDADAGYAELLGRQLAAWGFSVERAVSIDAAIERIPLLPAKPLLAMVGQDLRGDARRVPALRAAGRSGTMRIVLHSTIGRREEDDELVKLGYDCFFAKPLRVGQLARLLDTFAAKRPEAGKPGAAAEGVPAKKFHVLVAEDNLLNQKVVAKMLSNLGHSHDIVETGGEAVEAVERKHYDLVLMDWHMPEMDGLEATQRIRKLGGRYGLIPIVALTASALQNERQQCFMAGMNDYLSKPVTEKSIRAMLQKWLGGVVVG